MKLVFSNEELEHYAKEYSKISTKITFEEYLENEMWLKRADKSIITEGRRKWSFLRKLLNRR